jgi:formylmethanofuran dehydrogenase subunit D
MVINLKVKESPITKNGVARIHSELLQQLGVDIGKNVAVSCGNGSILVHIYADNLIEKNMISLRPGDRKKLRVRFGDEVVISPFIGIREKFKFRF